MTNFRTLFFFHNFSKIRIHFPWTFFWIHSLWNFSKIRIHPRKNFAKFPDEPPWTFATKFVKIFSKIRIQPLWKISLFPWIQTLKISRNFMNSDFEKFSENPNSDFEKFSENFLNSCSLNSTKIWIQTTSVNLTWHDVTWRQFPGKKVKGAKMANSWTST